MIPLYGPACDHSRPRLYRVPPRSRSNCPVSIHSWIVRRLTPNRCDSSVLENL